MLLSDLGGAVLGRRSIWLCSGLILAVGIALSLTEIVILSPWLNVIAGLLVFILPGGFLFALFPTRESWDAIEFVGYGFAYSMALITLLGLLTRTLSLSIDQVEFVWYVIALFGYVTVLARSDWKACSRPGVDWLTVALLAILLVQIAPFAHSSIYSATALSDQFRHHAAVNGFLRDDPLGWSEPYYESGNSIADRMYLTYWVLTQALVVEISAQPILHARYLLYPFVVIISVVAMYVFARNLAHGRRASLVYVGLGLFAYSIVSKYNLQAGAQLYAEAVLDKSVSAFALAPVAISCAALYATTGNRRAFLGFALAFLAAVSVHAIPGGFAAVIVGVFCVILIFKSRANWGRSAKVLGVLVLLFAPAVLVRLHTGETTIYKFDELPAKTGIKVYIYDAVNPLLPGTNLYAVHWETAGHFTYLLIALTALSAALRRLDVRSMLMLAYIVAAGVALVPYTAWIYGRLVSVVHVLRVLWLIPYGYMLGFVLETAYDIVFRGRVRTSLWVPSDRLLCFFVAALLVLTFHQLQSSFRVDLNRDITNVEQADVEFADIAELLDSEHDDRVWIAATDQFRERILAMHWKVISLSRYSTKRMSYYSNLPLDEMQVQREDNFRLYRADVPVEDKLEIIDRYGIDYLLFPKRFAWMVDALYQTDNQRFELVHSGETLRLVRVHY